MIGRARHHGKLRRRISPKFAIATSPRRIFDRRDATTLTGFTLVELLVVVTIIALLVGLLLPAVQAAREAARQSACNNNLRQLALALQAHHAAERRLPEGARLHDKQDTPSIGWQVLVLPYLEQRPVYDRIAPDEFGGAKLFAGNEVVPIYVCPSATPPTTNAGDLESANYVGVAGAGTTAEEWPLEEVICGAAATDGVLSIRSRVSMADVDDGTSNTLAIGERSVYPNDEVWTTGAVWYKFSSGKSPESACVAAAKHVVWPINALESGQIRSVRDMAAPPELRKALNNSMPFGSQHPGGARFAWLDGSVRVLADSTDLNVLRAMATRAGHETFDAPP